MKEKKAPERNLKKIRKRIACELKTREFLHHGVRALNLLITGPTTTCSLAFPVTGTAHVITNRHHQITRYSHLCRRQVQVKLQAAPPSSTATSNAGVSRGADGDVGGACGVVAALMPSQRLSSRKRLVTHRAHVAGAYFVIGADRKAADVVVLGGGGGGLAVAGLVAAKGLVGRERLVAHATLVGSGRRRGGGVGGRAAAAGEHEEGESEALLLRESAVVKTASFFVVRCLFHVVLLSVTEVKIYTYIYIYKRRYISEFVKSRRDGERMIQD